MKRILLISDTHGHLDERLQKHILEADEIWHAGDIGIPDVCFEMSGQKTIRAVHGNIDPPASVNVYPENQFFTCEGMRILITHIAGAFEKYSKRVNDLIRDLKPQVLICGHSHILKVAYDHKNELLYMNPGACGVQGFHHVKTALGFDVDGEKIRNLRVIELGSRKKI